MAIFSKNKEPTSTRDSTKIIQIKCPKCFREYEVPEDTVMSQCRCDHMIVIAGGITSLEY